MKKRKNNDVTIMTIKNSPNCWISVNYKEYCASPASRNRMARFLGSNPSTYPVGTRYDGDITVRIFRVTR